MFLWLWGLGEVLCVIYSVAIGAWPLVFQYLVNLGFISVIVWYKLYPTRDRLGYTFDSRLQ